MKSRTLSDLRDVPVERLVADLEERLRSLMQPTRLCESRGESTTLDWCILAAGLIRIYREREERDRDE